MVCRIARMVKETMSYRGVFVIFKIGSFTCNWQHCISMAVMTLPHSLLNDVKQHFETE